MAVRADSGGRSFASEELLPMTVQAGVVSRKFSHIWKRSVALSHFLPVVSGELVTGIARQVLPSNVSRVRELSVVGARLTRR